MRRTAKFGDPGLSLAPRSEEKSVELGVGGRIQLAEYVLNSRQCNMQSADAKATINKSSTT
jgi:hypothetical protein